MHFATRTKPIGMRTCLTSTTFWPGLAALQLGFIGLDLAKDETWQDAFDSANQAQSTPTNSQRKCRNSSYHPDGSARYTCAAADWTYGSRLG